MRIVCQKCSAAYAIDDKLVTAKGIRAQCPRCRHLQLVKASEAAPPTTEVPQPFSIPQPQPLAHPPGLTKLSEPDPFDFSGPPAHTQAPAAVPPPPAPLGAFDPSSDVLDFSDLGDPPPEPTTSPRALAPLPGALRRPGSEPPPPPPAPAAPAPQSSAPFDFSGEFSFDAAPPPPTELAKMGTSPGLRLKPKPAPAAPPPPPAPAPEPERAPAGPLARCKSCGKALDDPFDQALGVCDDCRNGPSNDLTAADSAGKPTASAAAAVQPSAPRSPSRPAPVETTEQPTVAEKRISPPAPKRSVATAYRDTEPEPSGSAGKIVAAAAVLLVLFGAGALYLFNKKPKPPPLAQKLPISSARPIEAMVDRWKAQFPGLAGSAAEHLAAGEERLALDTSTAYAEAEVEFQKALVLDKNNDRAIAGWALALAFGRGEKVDSDTQRMAEQMLVAAEQRGGDARVYAAHAHLLLVRGANLNDIQVLAGRATESPSDKDKALAHLALGQAYLTKNPKTAEDNFNLAVKADPKLKRAYLFQVRFMASQGEYRSAVLTLEKRLEADPDQFEASDSLARLYLEVGETALAKKAYQKAAQSTGNAFRSKLALAVFAYQHEGDLRGSAAGLDELLSRKDTLEKAQLAELLGHRAAVERLSGNAAGALAHAEAALQLVPAELNAHAQKLLAAAALGKGADARGELPHLKLGDAALEALFEARVLWAEAKFADAFEKLKKVAELDGRRTEALLLAGAAAMKAKNESKGWEFVLAKGLRADPMSVGPRSAMAAVFVGRGDFIGLARGVFASRGKGADDPNPHLAEAVISWHLGDTAAADAGFAKVIAADPTHATALSFRSLAALKRRDVPNGQLWGARAAAADRTSGLAYAALGSAQLLSNKTELARKSLQKAVELAPNLPLARVRLAEADFKVKKASEAKAALNTVLLADPACNEAKRVLYGYGT